jgi:hypothetical protein
MSEAIYIMTLCLPLGTILGVFGMKYFSAMRQAQAKLGHDEAYRQLAAQAAAAQAGIAEALADMRARLTSIEKVLRDVG